MQALNSLRGACGMFRGGMTLNLSFCSGMDIPSAVSCQIAVPLLPALPGRAEK